MKTKLILLILITGMFTACVRDLEVSEPTFQDVGFVTSEFRNLDFTASVNDYVSFADISVNALEHAWTITDGSYYLEGPITRNDTILEPFIIPDAGLVSTDKIVNVLFTKSGLQPVNLRNVFTDSVAYRTSNGPIPAVRENNQWVVDTTFFVDVYDTIVPIIDIRQNGVSVPFQSETDVITIEAGDVLEFVDLSVKDRITDRVWRIEESGSVTDSIGIFVFKKLGDFKGVADFTRSGDNIPFDFERYEIPATFSVVPSSKPFVVAGDIIELEDQTIQVPFNGEFAPFGSQESFFTVTVNGTEFAIESVSANSGDITILDIKLAETIYRSDTITVTYDGNGTLQSTDTRSPVAFTDLPVLMFQHEVAVYDFEANAINWTPHPDNLPTTTIEVSSEQAESGSNSLKVDSGAAGNWSGFRNIVENFPLEAGVQVQYEFKIYKEPGTSIGSFGPWIMRNGGADTEQQFWTDISAKAPDETWTTFRHPKRYAVGTSGDDFSIFIRHNGTGVVYFDDIRILEVDERP